MIEMRVDNLTADPNSHQEVVWLRSVEGSVMVPIEIGHTEYLSIYAELAGERMPRPLTHDLLRTVLTHFDAEVEEVQIIELKEGIFYAELVFSSNGKQIRLDARPSDCIALALKFGAPIFMDGKIIQQVGFKARVSQHGLELEPLNPVVSQPVVGQANEEEEEEKLVQAVEKLVDEVQLPSFDSLEDDIDPLELLLVLKEQLQKAVKEERYEDAGMIRDEIVRIESVKS